MKIFEKIEIFQIFKMIPGVPGGDFYALRAPGAILSAPGAPGSQNIPPRAEWRRIVYWTRPCKRARGGFDGKAAAKNLCARTRGAI